MFRTAKPHVLTILLGLATLLHVATKQYDPHVEERLRPYLMKSRFTQALADVGYVGRYWIGEVRDDILLGPEEPLQRFYWKEEVPFLYRRSRGIIQMAFLQKIQRFIEQCEARGVTVVVVPIPPKLAIEREYVADRLPEEVVFQFESRLKPVVIRSEAEDPYFVYSALPESAPKHIVDLFRVYRQHVARFPKDDIYVPTDSHWSSLGIALAARATTELLDERLGESLVVRSIKQEAVDDIRYTHDYLRHLRLPEWYLKKRPEFQWKERLYRLQAPTHDGLKNRVVLIGTSYSYRLRKTPFGFGPVIAHALRRRLSDFSINGGKSLAALRYFSESGLKLKRGDILVWEFPIRQPWLPGEDPNDYVPLIFETPARGLAQD